LDEVFVKIRGKQHYLWRAVDQDGEIVDGRLPALSRLKRKPQYENSPIVEINFGLGITGTGMGPQHQP
jgi:hypothetical protein